MSKVIELLNRKTMLADQIKQAVAEERMDDARRMEGQVMEIEASIMEAATEEDERRAAALSHVMAGGTFKPRNLAQAFLGAEDSFQPIVRDVTRLTAKNAAIYIPDPTVEETSLPTWGASPFYNFASTLASGSCDGPVKFWRRKSRDVNFQTWHPGKAEPDTKAASDFQWEPKTALPEIVASYVPVEVPTLSHYSELQNIITNELTIGYYEERDARALNGNDENGIVGVTNTVGIQTYTAASGDHVVDTIRKMVTLCIMKSRLYPTHVCVAPQVKEAIDLLKDGNGAYLTLMVNGRVWNLPVIEDINLVTAETSDSAVTTHYGVMVYYGNAAQLLAQDALTLRAGTIDKQFIQNQLCLLMEASNALKVVYPDAFVYCADGIPSTSVTA